MEVLLILYCTIIALKCQIATIAQYFYNVKNFCQLLRQKVRQRISVIKTINAVFVVTKTKHWLRCQFPGNMECVQVNLCQRLLFLHQLTHNMTTDCSWNYHENYKGRTWAEYVLLIFFACSFHGNSMNNLLSYCRLVEARIRASEKDLPVCFHYWDSLTNFLT